MSLMSHPRTLSTHSAPCSCSTTNCIAGITAIQSVQFTIFEYLCKINDRDVIELTQLSCITRLIGFIGQSQSQRLESWGMIHDSMTMITWYNCKHVIHNSWSWLIMISYKTAKRGRGRVGLGLYSCTGPSLGGVDRGQAGTGQATYNLQYNSIQ